MKRMFITALLGVVGIPLTGQTDFSFRNAFRYGDGQRFNGFGTTAFRYFENLTDMQITHDGHYRFGLRYTQDSPAETGLRKEEFSRWFAEYDTDSWTIRAGHSPALFGQGLSLNLFEDRGQGFDSWLQGLTGVYRHAFFRIQAIAGKVEIDDSLVFRRQDRYDLTGGSLIVLPSGPVEIGISAVHARGFGTVPTVPFSLSSDLSSFSIKTNFDTWSFLSDYLVRWTKDDITGLTKTGSAFYSSVSWFSDLISLTVDYKNYRLDVTNPIDRLDPYRPFKLLPFQNPPTVQKEHSWFFISRSLNEQDFNDQTGVQAEIFINPAEKLQLTANGSFSSRTTSWQQDVFDFTWSRTTGSLLLFPSSKEMYSPFHELFLEADYEFSDDFSLRGAVATRSFHLYNDFTGPAGSHQQSDRVLMGWLQWKVTDSQTTQVQSEWIQSDDNFSPDPHSSGIFLSWIQTIDGFWNVALRHERTTNTFDPGGRKDWTLFETGLRLDGRHLITVSGGQERGGLTCTNGVCRFIQPFTGVRVSIISTL
ncbi:MAG: hypothetical protein HUU10_12580 [Bacteroidetes bacterium]|nr:hypothetical protein [Bacteroidota bacterium]